MKIGIDARFLTHPQTGGFKTYTQNLVRALSQTDKINDYFIYLDRPPSSNTLPESPNFTYKIVNGALPAFGMPLREQVLLRQVIRKDNPDIVHYLCNTAPIRPHTNFVLTLHDTIQLEESLGFSLFGNLKNKKKWAINNYSKWTILNSYKASKRIITVSSYEKCEISRVLQIDSKLINVTHLAASSIFSSADAECKKAYRSQLDSELNLPQRFILGLGYESRKNIPLLIEVMVQLSSHHQDLYLVVVVADKRKRHIFQQLADELRIDSRVRLLPSLKQDCLVMLYNLAEVFVFPSERESFGLPPLEALACGTPTIAMNLTSHPEILGDGALLIDGKDVETWNNAINQVLVDSDLRHALVARGLHQAAKMSWQQCAESTLQIYEDVFENG